MSTPRNRMLVAAIAVSSALAAVALAPSAGATPSADLVVSQVYGGGGNSGATLKNDFIELRNNGSAPVDLSTWSVQYLSASPGATTTWQTTPLTGSIAPGGYYLVQEAAGSGGTADLPTPDATGAINLGGTAGTVALVTSQTALTCKTAADCAADATVRDLVGYGTAVVHEGTADAPTLSNTTADTRNATGADSDQNGADFTAVAPAPHNSASGGASGSPSASASPSPTATPGSVRIHDIQGAAWVSPLNGKSVTNVPGVVTAIRTSGSKGFWMQDPNADDNPATSEGIFVYTSSAPTVAVGDSVLVSAKVSQYYPLASGDTAATTSNLSVTELASPTVTTLSSGNPLPAPIVLSASNVPSTYAPNLGGGNIESTPITPSRSVLDFYESVEGMRVEVDNARVVGPSDSYGEQYVTVKPTEAVSYRGGSELTGENTPPSGRLEVVADNGTNPEVSVGDEFTGATIGTIDYSQYGGFLLAASGLGAVQAGNLAPVVATPAAAKDLSIATYNVENLAPSDADTKFAALAKGIVTNLAKPDIIALEEIQDNTGATDDGTVAADQTIGKLTAAIAAAGGPQYSYREIDPVNDQDGGQPGGNIRVVFLFNADRVSFVDRGPSDTDRSTTGTHIVDVHGTPQLTLSPGRIDPTNPVWNSSRKPLVGEFSFRGKPVFVIANHFDAKLGDQNQDGRFQYPAQSSALQRSGQAQVVHDFVQNLLAIKKNADVVVVGDLNDYQFSPALHSLTTGTADGTGPRILTDLITTLPLNQQYTYDYEGVSEVLDHILVSRGVSDSTYQVVHMNSEYANQTSDHDPQEVQFRP
ncbi:endonuclease/exonuclease/phosphatase family protein [Streptacidiphilus melanogenes]|uniref:endonuclease/exonuclease/phosphatase family protein n=1 Tax=Streptacidiphilus melanogenes TaxID=411235 RepID=UPI000ABC42B2|nr:endonuclease/exonuclease/phosphatase family protein [Streptacidiphilus melanogenes]